MNSQHRLESGEGEGRMAKFSTWLLAGLSLTVLLAGCAKNPGNTAAGTLAGETQEQSAAADIDTARSGESLSETEDSQAISTEEVDAQTPETHFEEYMKGQTCLYGKTYNGYLSKGTGENRYQLDYDVSKVPVATLGYTISDFDADGEKELLTVGLADTYDLLVSMYEWKDDTVLQADTMNLRDVDCSIRLSLASKEVSPATLDCFVYSENHIGIELWEVASLYGEGFRSDFWSIRYQDGAFSREGRAYYEGSDGQYNEDYMTTLETLGIKNISWEAILSGKKRIRSYVSDSRGICKMETVYRLSQDQFDKWMADDSGQKNRLKATQIHFFDKDEVK